MSLTENLDIFVKKFTQDAAGLSTKKLGDFFNNVKNSETPFVKDQYEILAYLVEQYNKKELNDAEYKKYIEDIGKLWEMEALNLQLQTKNFINGLVNDLLGLLVKSIGL